MQKLTLPVDVQPASPLPFVVVLSVFPGWEIQVAVVSLRLIGAHAGTAGLADEQAAHRKCVVPDEFRRQSKPGLPRQPLVIGIFPGQLL